MNSGLTLTEVLGGQNSTTTDPKDDSHSSLYATLGVTLSLFVGGFALFAYYRFCKTPDRAAAQPPPNNADVNGWSDLYQPPQPIITSAVAGSDYPGAVMARAMAVPPSGRVHGGGGGGGGGGRDGDELNGVEMPRSLEGLRDGGGGGGVGGGGGGGVTVVGGVGGSGAVEGVPFTVVTAREHANLPPPPIAPIVMPSQQTPSREQSLQIEGSGGLAAIALIAATASTTTIPVGGSSTDSSTGGTTASHEYVNSNQTDYVQYLRNAGSGTVKSNGEVTLTNIPHREILSMHRMAEGNFCVAYRAEWKKKAVVVKVAKKSTSSTLVDMLAELQATARLPPHANVLAPIGFSVVDTNFWLVSHYVSGGSLDNILRSSSKREAIGLNSIKTKIVIAADIARGMAHLHKNGVIHRDLAARNVLIDVIGTLPSAWSSLPSPRSAVIDPSAVSIDMKAPAPPSPYSSSSSTVSVSASAAPSSSSASTPPMVRGMVADFGMSVTAGPDTAYQMSHAEHVPVRWCSPESLSKRIFNTKTDVYSFGVTMYEILTNGVTPFKGMSLDVVTSQVGNGTLSLIPELQSMQSANTIPKTLFDLLTKCLNVSAASRPEFSEIELSLIQILTSL